MDKWADYGISAVQYDIEKTRINKVKVHEDEGDTIGVAAIWLRSDVISSLENNETFVTIIKGSDGKWKKGEDVRIVKINNINYIRTDRNQKSSDNLGNLPEV